MNTYSHNFNSSTAPDGVSAGRMKGSLRLVDKNPVMSKGSYLRPGEQGINADDDETLPGTGLTLDAGDSPQTLPDSPRRPVDVVPRQKPLSVTKMQPVIDPVETHSGSVLRDFIRREVRMMKSRRKRK